ncbi:glycosyltransferase [Micromonospora echinospora]|uniref:glycosyltransferase n=1 Tax=Micromonospora echinospora TaxID=1877 RepID=UPI003A8B198B
MTTLLVASTGGHLAELHDLVPRLGVQDDCVWATFDSPQSRSLLDGAEVIHVPPATSRDLVGAVRDLVAARRVLGGGRFSRVISTGASVAASFFLPALRAGVACHYIESATRTTGPSLTGRMVARLPGTGLYTQYPSWADGRWRYGGSIFDAYVPRESSATRPVSRVVVTLGTQKYGFPRLLERLTRVIPPSAEVLWQVGSTRIPRMPADARPQVPFAEMQQAMREADVVVTHAGVGSALTALRAGQRAIYVPRRRPHGEHVDDHQVEMARELDRRGLVLAREADQVTENDLSLATRWTVSARKEVEPFRWTNQT